MTIAVSESQRNVVLLCNPLAGGRWRVLSDVLDSEEARLVRRIVTDDIGDIREAIADLGQRVDLLCIYGGDGTIFRVLNDLLHQGKYTPPLVALLGGGTMNVTAAWCGMRSSPGDNFRQVMRAHLTGRLLTCSLPLLAVEHNGLVQYGFTFGLGPLVRVLERFEAGEKSRSNALALGLKTVAQAMRGTKKSEQTMLAEMEAAVIVDGRQIPFERFAAVFANTTGMLNLFVEPFVKERTRESFNFLAYAVSSREFALMAPLLARARLPIDPRSLLRPVSTWRQAMLSLAGKGELPPDPRYVNQSAQALTVETGETRYTIDGELLTAVGSRFEVRMGPSINLVMLAKPKRAAPLASDLTS